MFIIHDKRLPEEYKEALRNKLPDVTLFSFGGIDVSGKNAVYESISSHPDIYFFQLDEKTLVHAPELKEEALRPLRDRGIDLIAGECNPRGSYPNTSRYNVSRVGDFIFHNSKHTDPKIIQEARKRGLKLVDVSQGYARCSTLKLNDKAIVTSDKGIAEAAQAEEIDALLISPGSVSLPGEKHGFIGGASGRAGDGTVTVLGDLKFHPEALAIKSFMEKHACPHVSLDCLPLYDAGSLIIFS